MADKYDDLDEFLDEFEEQDRVFGPSSDTAGSKDAGAPAAGSKPAPGAPAIGAAGSTTGDLSGTTPPPAGTGAAGSSKSPAVAAASSKPTPKPEDDKSVAELDEEFARKLGLGMDDLVKEMENDPLAQQTLETLMASLTGADGNPLNFEREAAAGEGGQASFQDTISQTMNRLNESKQTAGPEDDGDFLEKMLKELQGAAGTGGMGGGDLDGLLAGLMEELSSKDILYEPIKEMHEKYPAWIESHKDELSAEDLKRYQDQQRAVDDIIAKFDEPSYSDEDPVSRKYIAARMEAMQSAGAPPAELVGNLADGAIPGGLPTTPGDCVIQ